MPTYTTFNYHQYDLTAPGTITQSGFADPIVAGDFTHTESGPGDNQFTNGETLFTTGTGVNFNLTWVGETTIGGTQYHVFELPTFPGAYYVFSTGADVDQDTDAEWPPTFDLATLDATAEAFCFAAGSLIATPDGEVAVEVLKIGDLVMTADGRSEPVKWIGHQTLHRQRGNGKTTPVRIRAGALGDGLPHSDLTVTADHGMMIDGLVINASALVNGTSIDFVPVAELPDLVTYYHIETPAHDAVVANGAAAETFVDIPGRMAFDNYAEYLDLYGTERIIPEMDRPRITAQRLLPGAIRARLGIVDEAMAFDQPLRA